MAWADLGVAVLVAALLAGAGWGIVRLSRTRRETAVIGVLGLVTIVTLGGYLLAPTDGLLSVVKVCVGALGGSAAAVAAHREEPPKLPPNWHALGTDDEVP